MRCDECGLEAYIMQSRTEVTGDQEPDTQTEVWTVLDFECRNPQCPRCGHKIGEARSRIYPGPSEAVAGDG